MTKKAYAHTRRADIKRRKRKKRFRRRLKRLAFLLCEAVVLILLVNFAVRTVTDEITGSGFPAKNDSLTVSTVLAADAAVTQNETELEWVKNHPDLFGGLRPERVIQNPGLTHFLYRYGTGDYETGKPIVVAKSELQNGIPLFLQWDARWGYDAYGEDVIGLAGCGPTCLAMVISGLTGNTEINPRTVADFAMQNDFYLYGTGTKWSLMTEGASMLGLGSRQIGTTEDAIRQELTAGRAVILNVGSGHFTSSGHFIVVCGTDDGTLVIRDPNSLENSNTRWHYRDIADEIRAAWSFGC